MFSSRLPGAPAQSHNPSLKRAQRAPCGVSRGRQVAWGKGEIVLDTTLLPSGKVVWLLGIGVAALPFRTSAWPLVLGALAETACRLQILKQLEIGGDSGLTCLLFCPCMSIERR